MLCNSMKASSHVEGWAIVTGAAGGIGGALREALLERGVRVAGIDVVLPRHDDLVQEAVDLREHVRVAEILDDLVESHGPPNLLAHVAGIYPLQPIFATDDQQVETVLAVNFVSAVRLCRAMLPAMEERGSGRILLVTSQAGVTGGTDAVYASSKAALVALGKSLARDCGPSGVRVNMVSPGPVETSMAGVMSIARREHYEQRIPIRRFTQPEEVARLAAFVLLDAPDALNGATIDIDGGLVRR